MYLLLCFFARVRGDKAAKVPIKSRYLQKEGETIIKKLFGTRELNFSTQRTYRDYRLLLRDNASYLLSKRLRLAVEISSEDLTEKKYRFLGELHKLLVQGGTLHKSEKELLELLLEAWSINPIHLKNFLKKRRMPFPNQKFRAFRTNP
ncbi:MAG: hypothetical protein AAF518_10725 [Spirochaetota bacterium]